MERLDIKRDKTFYRALLGLMLPIALQNMITTGVGIMDTVMLGSFGDAVLSGASLGNQPSFFIQSAMFGLASGAGVLISQYIGRGNREAAGRILAVAMRFVVLVGAVMSAVCGLFPEAVIRIFNSNPPVVALGARYLRIVALSYLPMAVSSSYLMALRAVSRPGYPTLVYAGSFFVNIFFNYCFIFGRLGFPRLEIEGAAVGTVIARLFELGMVLLRIGTDKKDIPFRWRMLFHRERQLTADFMRTALPVTGNEILWSLGSLATAVIIGHLGTVFVTANSVAGIVQQLGMVMMFGVGNAAAVLVGRATGRGDFDEARRISRTMLLVSLGAGVFATGMVLLLRAPLLTIYSISAEAAAIAYDIMGVMAVLLLFVGLEITSITGILRGGGDTAFAFRVDCGAMWLVSVPMGILAGYVLRLPPIWVYVFLRMDLPFRLLFCLPRILRGNFLKNVTRDDL